MITMTRPRTNRAAMRSSLPACIAALLAASAPTHAVTPATAGTSTDGPVMAAFRASRVAGSASAARPPAARAVAFAGTPSSQLAGEIVVTSCADDDGFDTLRHAVLVANSGDTVNLSALPCSTITLQSGAIAVGLTDLTILGPGAGKLAINGADADRVFSHSGLGTLTLNDLTVTHGTWAAVKAYGGCIYSKGSVSLNRSVVTACTALGQSIAAGGGIVVLDALFTQLSAITDNVASAPGIPAALSAAAGGAFAVQNVRLIRSVVSGNSAHAPTGKVYGGGLVSPVALTVKYSTLSNNVATAASTVESYGSGGAIFGSSALTIIGSTIDHNTADVAGALVIQDNSTSTASIAMTTISSNTGNLAIGAITSPGPISILGSTIAFNTSGPLVNVAVQLGEAQLQSTIIADNSPIDLGSDAITGGKNLIKTVSPGTVVPMDTKTQDPNLLPLAFNGGPTRTHALGAGSPAINNGSNAANYDFDQRGPTYRRDVGVADIGAYEVDTDHIFGTSLDFPLGF